jgi:hypothetical protein
MHGSFSSILRLFDVFGEFAYIVRSFTVVRLLFGGFSYLWQAVNKFFGRKLERRSLTDQAHLHLRSSSSFTANDVDMFERRRGSIPGSSSSASSSSSSFPTPLVLVALGVLSIPFLLVKVSTILRRKARELKLDEAWDGPRVRAYVLHDFAPENPQDLPMKKDEVIVVVARPFPDWWEGESLDGRRRGLFPANFVREMTETMAPAGAETMGNMDDADGERRSRNENKNDG